MMAGTLKSFFTHNRKKNDQDRSFIKQKRVSYKNEKFYSYLDYYLGAMNKGIGIFDYKTTKEENLGQKYDFDLILDNSINGKMKTERKTFINIWSRNGIQIGNLPFSKNLFNTMFSMYLIPIKNKKQQVYNIMIIWKRAEIEIITFECGVNNNRWANNKINQILSLLNEMINGDDKMVLPQPKVSVLNLLGNGGDYHRSILEIRDRLNKLIPENKEIVAIDDSTILEMLWMYLFKRIISTKRKFRNPVYNLDRAEEWIKNQNDTLKKLFRNWLVFQNFGQNFVRLRPGLRIEKNKEMMREEYIIDAIRVSENLSELVKIWNKSLRYGVNRDYFLNSVEVMRLKSDREKFETNLYQNKMQLSNQKVNQDNLKKIVILIDDDNDNDGNSSKIQKMSLWIFIFNNWMAYFDSQADGLSITNKLDLKIPFSMIGYEKVEMTEEVMNQYKTNNDRLPDYSIRSMMVFIWWNMMFINSNGKPLNSNEWNFFMKYNSHHNLIMYTEKMIIDTLELSERSIGRMKTISESIAESTIKKMEGVDSLAPSLSFERYEKKKRKRRNGELTRTKSNATSYVMITKTNGKENPVNEPKNQMENRRMEKFDLERKWMQGYMQFPSDYRKKRFLYGYRSFMDKLDKYIRHQLKNNSTLMINMDEEKDKKQMSEILINMSYSRWNKLFLLLERIPHRLFTIYSHEYVNDLKLGEIESNPWKEKLLNVERMNLLRRKKRLSHLNYNPLNLLMSIYGLRIKIYSDSIISEKNLGSVIETNTMANPFESIGPQLMIYPIMFLLVSFEDMMITTTTTTTTMDENKLDNLNYGNQKSFNNSNIAIWSLSKLAKALYHLDGKSKNPSSEMVLLKNQGSMLTSALVRGSSAMMNELCYFRALNLPCLYFYNNHWNTLTFPLILNYIKIILHKIKITKNDITAKNDIYLNNLLTIFMNNVESVSIKIDNNYFMSDNNYINQLIKKNDHLIQRYFGKSVTMFLKYHFYELLWNSLVRV